MYTLYHVLLLLLILFNSPSSLSFRLISNAWPNSRYSIQNRIQMESFLSSLDYPTNINLTSKAHKALVHYYHSYNSTTIPISFKISRNDTDWPVEVRGYDLGKSLKRCKSDRIHLNVGASRSILFTIDHKSTNDQKFDAFVESLRVLKSLNNTYSVPRDWKVPCRFPWPEMCWNLKLSSKITAVRSGLLYSHPRQIAQLNDIGFPWDPQYDALEAFRFALTTYKSIHGHLSIPKDYVIPGESEVYPSTLWNMRLGMKVDNVRYRGDFSNYRKEFIRMGLDIEKAGMDTRHWDHIYLALKSYKSVYRNLDVPKDFIIPYHYPWPEECWGLKIGYRVFNIRYRGDYINSNNLYRDKLEAIGFIWDNRKRRKVEFEVITEEDIDMKQIEDAFVDGRHLRYSRWPSNKPFFLP